MILRNILACILTAITVLILLFYLFYKWPVLLNYKLEKYGVPTVDSYEKFIAYSSGGFFSQWMFAAIKVNDNQMNKYKKKIVQDGSVHYKIGNDGIKILTLEEDYKIIKYEFSEYRIKQRVNGKYLEWWDIDKITVGDLYENELPDECRYKIYFSPKQGIIYIYWARS